VDLGARTDRVRVCKACEYVHLIQVAKDIQYTGAGMDTDRVEAAYTWHRANESDCIVSALNNDACSECGRNEEITKLTIIRYPVSRTQLDSFVDTSATRTYVIQYLSGLVNRRSGAKERFSTYRIVRWPTSPEQASVALQIKVELGRMTNITIDDGPSRTIPAPVRIPLVGE
jgi:hypothetical protein